MIYRLKKMTATTGAVSWLISSGGNFDIVRLDIVFSSAPTTSENITVTRIVTGNTDNNTVVRTTDPSGFTSISFEGLNGLCAGEGMLVTYANTDASTINISAVVSL